MNDNVIKAAMLIIHIFMDYRLHPHIKSIKIWIIVFRTFLIFDPIGLRKMLLSETKACSAVHEKYVTKPMENFQSIHEIFFSIATEMHEILGVKLTPYFYGLSSPRFRTLGIRYATYDQISCLYANRVAETLHCQLICVYHPCIAMEGA